MDPKKKCYCCGKIGHIAKNCRLQIFKKIEKDEYTKNNLILIKNKVTRCYICKKLGHKSKECPGKYFDVNQQSKRNDEPSGNPNFINQPYGDETSAITQAFDSIDEHEWDFMKNENQKEIKPHSSDISNVKGLVSKGEESKYYKVVVLSNIKFAGYLDTCSEKCLIKYSAAKRAQLNVQLDDTDVMANSPTFQGKIISIGKALTTMSVDSVEIPNMELFVVNDNVLNIDVVVGRSWLDHPNILLLKIENAVHVGDITLHPFDKFASILSSFDVKLTNKRTEVDPNFDALSSGEEDFGKSNNPAKKHEYFLDDYRDTSPHMKKSTHDIDYSRDRMRDMTRERSRSRERMRGSLRDSRSGNIERSRRSRSRSRSLDRSRERYMSRHSGRR